MRSFLTYFSMWISGVIVFTIGYTVYLRENDIPVRYENEIPQEIRMPVYIFAGIFIVILAVLKIFMSYTEQSSK